MYFVVEIQSNQDGTASTLIDAYSNIGTAQNKYHTILAAAAVSNVWKHGAYMFTEDGFIGHECFTHESE